MRRCAGLVALTFAWLPLLVTSCTPKQAPLARSVGKVMSIGGVLGIIGSTLAGPYIDQGDDMLKAFSIVSGLGLVTYAAAEMSQPEVVWKKEPLPQRNHRWAKILTERAAGAARDGRCARVRRLEPRVHKYDAAVHDLVFMRDPEILRCLSQPAPASGLYPDGSAPPVVIPPDATPIAPPTGTDESAPSPSVPPSR